MTIADKPAMPPLDLKILRENVGGNTSVIEKLVAHVAETLPGQINRLEQLIAAGQSNDAMRLAHSIKGSLANFSADRAVELALEIETLAREEKTRALPAVMNLFRLEAEKILSYLASDAWRKEEKQPPE